MGFDSLLRRLVRAVPSTCASSTPATSAGLASRVSIASALALVLTSSGIPGAETALVTVAAPDLDPAEQVHARSRELSFEDLEELEVSAGLVARRALPRRAPETREREGRPSRRSSGGIGRIEASVYSLPSSAFALDEVVPFLEGVLALESTRTVLVLSDGALAEALRDHFPASTAPRLRVLDTHRDVYSPWPRDAMTFGRGPKNRVELILRPNRQSGREHDAEMALELVQSLPPDLDRAWGKPRWRSSTVPFHNGQLLVDDTSVWISLHTVERRVLELLGERSVPIASLATVPGVERYLASAELAARELGALYGRPARFVHALPSEGDAAERHSTMMRLGGGAGLDLDSLVTLLPRPEGPMALVGSFERGAGLIEGAGERELRELVEVYAISVAQLGRRGLRQSLLERLGSPRARAYEAYLDTIAAHLANEGIEVRRHALLLLPGGLVKVQSGPEPPPDTLIGWNNVEIEIDAKRRAEGFGSGVAAWDEAARAVFAQAGYELDLLPPLVRSVLYNGGYRCASNHLRAAP